MAISMKLHLNHFLKIKIHKEVTKQWELRFSLLFLLEKDPEPDFGSGSVPRTNGTGSGCRRPKNIDPDPQHC
jgi:hypothetical protein